MTANIAQSICIEGDLVAEEDLAIEGRVEGKINLKDHDLWIGLLGNVRGEIRARNVFVAGTVVGSIFATEMVEIEKSGSMQGSIQCSRISLVEGAKFTGRLDKKTVRLGSLRAQAVSMGQSS